MHVNSAIRLLHCLDNPAQRATRIIAGMLMLAVLTFLFACTQGSVTIDWSEMPSAFRELLRGDIQSLAASLLELRMTRAATGFITGASLAVAGVFMQALLRNPLADPYVLGISSGASVAALAWILFFGVSIWLDLAAFAGAAAVTGILFALAYRDFRSANADEGRSPTLILTGVILATGCGALITLMLSVAPDSRLRGMVFWMIGDLSSASFRLLPWLCFTLVMLILLPRARDINLHAMHAENAQTLGVNVSSLRKILFFCAALLTASSVSTAGSIGFVGLIMPHACRFALGADHRLLIPASALAGGSFLMFADTIARTIVAPQQLPVGVITALVGVPVFLLQLRSIRRK